jgi:photosystem II stability/assembly factor-like uncharacterized protein
MAVSMPTSAVLALLLTLAAQKDADRTAAPERPVFGFPSEEGVPTASEAVSAANSSAASDTYKRPPVSFLSDARLADICFVDDQYGWAVGDRGVIWHTQDGGGQWRLQSSGVNCSLQSVCFLTRKIGFAAGGSVLPYSHVGAGALLTTRNGGETWTAIPRLTLPMLKKILFIDPEHGWAIGFPSAMYRSGVMASDDGGRSWRPLFGSGDSAWLTGDFLTPSDGALAGCYAAAGTVGRGKIEAFCVDRRGLQNLWQLRLVPPVYGWLVGDGGLAMLTGNAGAAWRVPSGNFPARAAGHFDFAALVARGPKAWIAGTPGTRIFFTPDAGATWERFSTGVSIPITALAFADDRHGWAAGAMGTILATSDGGRTWRSQRSGGTRAAVLALLAQADDLPLELLAKLSGNDGYLSAVEVLARRDIEVRPLDEIPLAERLEQAAADVGASHAQVAWQFPLRQSGLQLAEEHYRRTSLKNIPHDASPQNADDDVAQYGRLDMNALEEYIIKQLRLWRPDVVIADNVVSRRADRLGPLIGKAVLQAVEKAADPSAYPDQIAEAGLSPWQVKKVYAQTDPGAHGQIELAASEFAAGLGRSLADAAADPRGLVSDRVGLTPTTLGFDPLADRATPGNRQSHDIMAGLALVPGGGARRELTNVPAENFDALRRAALKQRNAQAILEQALRNPGKEANLLAQSGELIRGLDDDSAARMLYHLADQCHRTGRWTMAAETLTMLADRYPRHPLARPALLWLIRYHTSGEIAHQRQSAQKAVLRQTPPPALDSAKPEDRLAGAAALGKLIERTRPDLFAEPALRFPLAAAWRKQGMTRQAEQFYLAAGRGPDGDAWSACAKGEIALNDANVKQYKPMQTCWKAAARPKLDGRLDDAVWRKIETVPLKSALNDGEDWPALAAFACDDEFLYIAVTCRRAPGVKYEPAATPRPRDADLSAQDRVDVFIDIDRDFATYYQLSFDYRGFTAESLWGDPGWNPTWFVAADLSEEAWTVEAAIALDQIADQHPKPRDAWAVGVQRTIPGVGFQAWSFPASIRVMPEGFGYLIFQ